MALLAALASAALLLLPTTPVGAADVDLGTPETITDLLDAAEYVSGHADVLRLYRACLNREPDIGGSLYWIEQFESGASLDALAYGFAQSDEFTNAYGSTLSDREFIARHPYSSTATDLTPALLQASDLTGDHQPEPVSLAVELDGCDTALASHPNSLATGFIDANNVSVVSTLHRYATVERARSRVARIRNDLETCIRTDPTLTVADLDIGPLGDDTLAVSISRLDGSESAFDQHSVFFRHGTVVYRYVVLAPFDLGENVEVTRTIATDLSGRLAALLS